ncbi:hypothetical protein PC116_g12651 [Phytophthora cactorum]|uniref:Uncharacterized protein n=1 Tax=Phytophthora cactorum TaxID=29920 RepID=A0A8T1DQG3_9STRA|nr:hypothetical protein Pcac1_g15975 [Phytophthora cactorum]KAG2943168.1 hypothetical protein PC117_g9520 [Phytophthora cactorum]KAG4239358.1 hypothetical protein PC116_g12651 [Phytophthora cactorum]
MRWSVRAVLLHHLQRSALSNLLLDNDVVEEDNDLLRCGFLAPLLSPSTSRQDWPLEPLA